MKLLQEFIKFTRYDAPTDEASSDIVDTQEVGQGMWAQGKFGDDVGEFSVDVEDVEDVDVDGEVEVDDVESTEGNEELDGIAQQATEDPDRAGLIRRVPNARLVYKRETADGSFEELWIYNVGNIKDELAVRKAILAGTDIPTNQTQSPDGTQNYTVWTSGNAEILHILGLPQ